MVRLGTPLAARARQCGCADQAPPRRHRPGGGGGEHAARAQSLTEAVLTQVTQVRAHVVILDISGSDVAEGAEGGEDLDVLDRVDVEVALEGLSRRSMSAG